MSILALRGFRRALAVAASLFFIVGPGAACAVPVDALPLPGPYAVACSDVAQDASRIAPGASATEYWEGTRARYATDVLGEPAGSVVLAVPTPDDATLFGSYRGQTIPYVALVCYPTAATNPRPGYALPNGNIVPHMQRAGDAPLLADPAARYPVLLFSHGYGGSPLSGDYFDAILVLASYGYVVAAPFHGDPRFSDLTPDNLSNLFYLVSHLSDFTAMQALRPLALSALLDRVLSDPAWAAHVDGDKVGGFGASQGGESLLLMAGAGLTTSIGQSFTRVEYDRRLKAAVGYIPYFGQSIFPAFGRDAHGLDGVTLPYLAIGGTADFTAPLAQTRQGLSRLSSPRALVTLDGVDHRFDIASAGDIYTWSVTFLAATVRGHLASYARLAAMTSVAGGGNDQLDIPLDGAQSANFGGLWWNAPAGSESGWGLNLAHQGDVIYATWFTYDAAGKATWLAMTANRTGASNYTGTMQRAHGPAFDAMPFLPAAVALTSVGTGTLTFDDGDNGRFTYTVDGVAQTKAITRQVFGPQASCWFGTQPDLGAATNYQDLWWNAPAGSESGWGMNLTHQGDTIFATWFTYDRDGTPLWLSATAARSGDRVYTGNLIRTTGPVFGAPFDPSAVTRTGRYGNLHLHRRQRRPVRIRRARHCANQGDHARSVRSARHGLPLKPYEERRMQAIDTPKVVSVLNRLLEAELAGVVRYTHYSFLVFGFGRIPIVSWLRSQANESLVHAQEVGEWVTTLGAHPSLAIGALLDSHQHDIAQMLRESLDSEGQALLLYRELLDLVEGRSIALEEFARRMIHAEEVHAAEVDKMLRKPGDLAAFAPHPPG